VGSTAADPVRPARFWRSMGPLRDGLLAGEQERGTTAWAHARSAHAPRHQVLVRRAHAEACDFDLAGMFEKIKRREIESGVPVVSLPPRLFRARLAARNPLSPSSVPRVRQDLLIPQHRFQPVPQLS
jgi:hypothetical protein